MDANAKKTPLRMIPYGLYVRTGESDGRVAAAFLDRSLLDTVEKGDHSILVGEVFDAGVARDIPSRPDDETRAPQDLGDETFYGG